MMHYLNPFSIYLVLLTGFTATPSSAQRIPALRQRSSISVETIYQFPKPTWIENIAVRSNGNLLLTLLDKPELHLLDPLTYPPTHTLIHSFNGTSNITGLVGIAELIPDVFTFVAGNPPTINGTYGVWKVDLRTYSANHTPVVTKVTDVPNAQLLNGMTRLNPHTLLISDSAAGHVVALDTETGESDIVLQDNSMRPGPTIGGFWAGVNGLHVVDDYLYYVNTFTAVLSRVQVDVETGRAIESFETIATDLVDADDFAIQHGIAYVTRDSAHVIERVQLDGTHEVIAGNPNSSAIPGPTSAAFGRREVDGNILYVTTNGGQGNPNNTDIVGGSVVAVRIM